MRIVIGNIGSHHRHSLAFGRQERNRKVRACTAAKFGGQSPLYDSNGRARRCLSDSAKLFVDEDIEACAQQCID